MASTGAFRIGYKNLLAFASATVVASSEDSSFPVANVLNRQRVDRWRSGVVDTTHYLELDNGPDEAAPQEIGGIVTGNPWLHTCASVPKILPGSLSIKFPIPAAFTDDGAGNITGTGISSGTVDYVTGAISITFSAAPTGIPTIDYSRVRASLPDYFGLTDLLRDEARDAALGISVGYSDDGAAWTDVAYGIAPWPTIFHFFDNSGMTPSRYWRLGFGPVTSGESVSVSNAFLGEALTLSENVEPPFDPMSVTAKGRSAQALGGMSLGTVRQKVEWELALRIGKAGLDADDFTGDCGGGSSQNGVGPSASGWAAPASLDRYIRSYFIPGHAHFIHWDGRDGALIHGFGVSKPRLRTQFRHRDRRDFKVAWDLDPDKLSEADQ